METKEKTLADCHRATREIANLLTGFTTGQAAIILDWAKSQIEEYSVIEGYRLPEAKID